MSTLLISVACATLYVIVLVGVLVFFAGAKKVSRLEDD